MSAAQRSLIDGPAGQIEVLLETPAVATPGVVAVCCHPHPLYGGTLQNKVVHALSRAALDAGVPAVRFNFRGVGASEGGHDGGVGEVEDAAAVAEWAQARTGASRLWSMGFSFGAFIAFQLAVREAAERLVTVAPPVQRFDFTHLTLPTCRWLVVQGDQDELVNHERVSEWTRGLHASPRVLLFEGADHFFHGRISDLRHAVGDWLGS